MQIPESVTALVAEDLKAVDALIRARLASDVPLIQQVARHIIGGGGKRLRPWLRSSIRRPYSMMMWWTNLN
ncbi:MAG: Octaprenyl-diphosphate synthase [Betaproteobacteria bacterium ADurb.Bin341]|nr:MAG: Octaprenyl-diphosphate synthase [Betaproteobacteria bacterium ADurb.Bin341]